MNAFIARQRGKLHIFAAVLLVCQLMALSFGQAQPAAQAATPPSQAQSAQNTSPSSPNGVIFPDLTVTKSNDASGSVSLSNGWTWTLHVANTDAPTFFSTGNVVLTDALPSTPSAAATDAPAISGVSYTLGGTNGVANASGVTGTVTCSITANTLTCTASGPVSIAASGSFDVLVNATATATGTYTNGGIGAGCSVDPNNVVSESNEADNDCNADTVSVVAPDLTVVKSNSVSGGVILPNGWTWTLHVANGGNSPANFSNGDRVLTDPLPTGSGSNPPTYTLGGTSGVANSSGVVGVVSCTLSSNIVSCTASGAVVIAPSGSFDVLVNATPNATGTYANGSAPFGGAPVRRTGTNTSGSNSSNPNTVTVVCSVDSFNSVTESDESNNDCNSDTVTVASASDVEWIDAVGVVTATNIITRTSSGKLWTAGATSNIAISSGDGFVQATVISLSEYFFMGLSNGDTDQSYYDIDHAWYARPVRGLIYVFESGVPKAWFPYALNDVLKVAVEGNSVKYYQNGLLRYTSLVTLSPVSYPLRLDTSILTVGGRVAGTGMGGANQEVVAPNPPPGPMTCEAVNWTNTVNTTAFGNNLFKTSGGSHFNGGAVSDKAIQLGDGYAEATVPGVPALSGPNKNGNGGNGVPDSPGAGGYVFFGLSKGDSGQHYSDIDFALYTYPPTQRLVVYENGVSKGSWTPYNEGDVLRVAVEGTHIRYYQNGTLIYTSLATISAANYPLLMDSALLNVGDQVYNANICAGAGSITRPTSFDKPSRPQTQLSNPLTFSDVHAGDYYYDAVRYLSGAGIVGGYQDGTFRPNAQVTRGQVAKMAVQAAGWRLIYSPVPTFKDVEIGDTFYPYVETAAANGLVTGYEDGTFRPNAPVTRGQLAKMVVLGMTLPIDTSSQARFTDVAAGSTFYSYIQTAYAHGFLSGYADGTFRAGANATRGQVAKVVYLSAIDPFRSR